MGAKGPSFILVTAFRLSVTLSLTSLAALFIASCHRGYKTKAPLDAGTTQGVNLGRAGNQEVLQSYNRYTAKPGGCQSSGPGPRILMTGFGLFQGVDFNISGTMIANMASPQFLPSELHLKDPAHFLNDAIDIGALKVQTADMNPADSGGRAFNRTLLIDDKPYQICFLLLDVKWDLAAAITIFEMQRFQPNLVMMSGLGSMEAIFEGGATNKSLDQSGFEPNGSPDTINAPVAGEPLLPEKDPGVLPEVSLMWKNAELQKVTEPLIRSLGFQVQAPAMARPENDYICNNITYLVRESTMAPKLELAGGLLILNPKIKFKPQIGFFHYPIAATSDTESLLGWSRILATIFKTALP